MSPLFQDIHADPKDCRRLLLYDGRPMLAIAGGGHEHPFTQLEIEQISTWVSVCWNRDDHNKNIRLEGEAKVLRGLLTEALSVLGTISDESEPDNWMLLMALKGRIEAALNPLTEGALL